MRAGSPRSIGRRIGGRLVLDKFFNVYIDDNNFKLDKVDGSLVYIRVRTRVLLYEAFCMRDDGQL